MHEKIRTILNENPIIPVYTPSSVKATVEAAHQLVQQNIRCIEITLRTDCAMEAIEAVKKAQQNGLNMVVGAGTISDSQTLRELKAMHIDFGVSPGLTSELLQTATQEEFPLLPGIATPSELLQGVAHGYETFKLFPANALHSHALLKAFNATYPQVRFCPTGGINAENSASFLSLPNVIAVGGSWLFK